MFNAGSSSQSGVLVRKYVCKMRWVGMRTGSQSVEEQLVVAATTEVGKSTNTNTKTR